MRVGLSPSPISLVRETKRAAPTQTKALVRSPAGCWWICRSTPIATPIIRATPTLTRKEMISIALPRPVVGNPLVSATRSSSGLYRGPHRPVERGKPRRRSQPRAVLPHEPLLDDLRERTIPGQDRHQPGEVGRGERHHPDRGSEPGVGDHDPSRHDDECDRQERRGRPARSGPSARSCRPCIDRFSPHDGFDPRTGGSEVHRHIKNQALVVEESKLTIGCTFEITVRPHLPPELVHVAREEMDVGMTWGLIAQTDLEVQDRNFAPETVEKYAAGRLTGRSHRPGVPAGATS